MSRRVLTTNEIADVLEELADEEDVHAIDVYIEPPCDGQISDGDSGDEDCSDIARLNRHQLLAPAELLVHRSHDGGEPESNEPVQNIVGATSNSSSTSAASGSLSGSTRRPQQSVIVSQRVIQPDTDESIDGPLTNQEQRRTHTRQRQVAQSRPRKWVKQDLPPQQDDWSQPPARAVLTLCKESEPLSFFELFFNEEVIRYIVRLSVMYAVHQNHNTNFVLSGDEMYCFLGILILTGYAPLPRRRMYWESNEDTHNVLVANSMRRNRFEEIFRYFHVADNENLRQSDKMAKVRPLFDCMNEKFMTYAPIEKHISVDESMIPYYGRHGCKQHIHGKPIRFGFKAWVAATRLGYCLHADLYEGKSEQRTTGLGEHVVTKLSKAVKSYYPETQFSVFCDNFFTSPSLLSNLQEINIKITGTARPNRIDKCPLKDVNSVKKENRGFFDYRLDRNDKILAVRWHDNNVVTVLSNEFGVQPIQKATRYSVAAKKKVDIEQPYVIHQYNRFMGGVDRLDGNVGTYRIAIRGKKWYMGIIMWLIDVTVNNSALLARSMGVAVDTLEFRRSIARSLLQKYGQAKIHPGPRSGQQNTVMKQKKVPMSVRKHSAEHLILTGQVRKRCALCSNKTTKICRKCNVNLHDKCFAEFHA